MANRRLTRPIVQLAALCLTTALFIFAASKRAEAYNECVPYAAACAAQCGTTVTVGVLYTFWHFQCIEVSPGVWEGCWVDVNYYSLGSGVEYFECQEADPSASICMCRY